MMYWLWHRKIVWLKQKPVVLEKSVVLELFQRSPAKTPPPRHIQTVVVKGPWRGELASD